MLTHAGEKSQKCKFCEYSCIQRSAMKNHTRTHTKEKPFKCTQCEYSCIQANDLRIHRRVHSGEKPYKCDRCEYSSAKPHHYKNHSNKHDNDKKVNKCATCDFSCNELSGVRRHVEEMHQRKLSHMSPLCVALNTRSVHFPAKSKNCSASTS